MAERVIEVVGAIIKDGERYLVGRRPLQKSQGGFWEFMGGKIEPGETPEAALARECREELALEIENERIIDSVVHTYSACRGAAGGEARDKTIRLTLIECTPKPGSTPTALEHSEIRWVTPSEMRALPFAAADAELIEKLFPEEV